ncbi:hypothetical protein B4100_2953 [Heyndrickxia coagulans]|nr:hypothetical protein B4100_2953 [Heyndrickxia coagulans]
MTATLFFSLTAFTFLCQIIQKPRTAGFHFFPQPFMAPIFLAYNHYIKKATMYSREN